MTTQKPQDDARATEQVRFSADFPVDPALILKSTCQMQLEGLIAKRADAPYVARGFSAGACSQQ